MVRGDYREPVHVTNGSRCDDFVKFAIPCRKMGDCVAGGGITFVNIPSEKKLRDSEERPSFLLGLGDALRPLTAVKEIAGMAVRMLGEQLDLDRVVYVETFITL